MDENKSNAILNLMQNIVDKLEDMDQKLNQNGNNDFPDFLLQNNDELKALVTKLESVQSELMEHNLDVESRIMKHFESKEQPHSVSNHIEYSFFGRESYLKPKILLVVLFCITILWSSIQYLPSYFIEHSHLKKEAEDYKIFYNYVNINDFIKSKNSTASDLLKKIKEKDSAVINDYNLLSKIYEKEMKKQQLKEELDSLEKK